MSPETSAGRVWQHALVQSGAGSSAERAVVMARLSRLLSEAGHDPDRVIEVSVGELAARVGDICSLWLPDESERPTALVPACRRYGSSALEALGAKLGSPRVLLDRDTPAGLAYRTGQTQLWGELALDADYA
jgi:hypothetical protein